MESIYERFVLQIQTSTVTQVDHLICQLPINYNYMFSKYEDWIVITEIILNPQIPLHGTLYGKTLQTSWMKTRIPLVMSNISVFVWF